MLLYVVAVAGDVYAATIHIKEEGYCCCIL